MQVKYIGEWLGSRHNNGGAASQKGIGNGEWGWGLTFVFAFGFESDLKLIRAARGGTLVQRYSDTD